MGIAQSHLKNFGKCIIETESLMNTLTRLDKLSASLACEMIIFQTKKNDDFSRIPFTKCFMLVLNFEVS